MKVYIDYWLPISLLFLYSSSGNPCMAFADGSDPKPAGSERITTLHMIYIIYIPYIIHSHNIMYNIYDVHYIMYNVYHITYDGII